MTPGSSYVIDTGVAPKWYVPEPGTPEALAHMGPDIDRHAPGFLPHEGAHALLERSRGATPDLSPAEARQVALALRDHAPIRHHDSRALLELALDLAHQIGDSSYDGLFLALAILLDGRVVTADGKFRDKIAAGHHAPRVRLHLDPP